MYLIDAYIVKLQQQTLGFTTNLIVEERSTIKKKMSASPMNTIFNMFYLILDDLADNSQKKFVISGTFYYSLAFQQDN